MLVLFVLLAGVIGPAALEAAPAAQEEPTGKIDPDVLAALRTAGQAEYFVWMKEQADLAGADRLETKQQKGEYVYATLRATAERSQRDLRAFLDAQGVRYRPFYIANKIYVYGASLRTALDIAARPDVARITPNQAYQLPAPMVDPKAPRSTAAIEPNLTFMRADAVWTQGITGAGTVLAGNDTGLQWDHPAIVNHYRGWNGTSANHNYSWWDATGTYPNAPTDGGGHGTHTTGTMVGNDGGANQIGVAPGARTIHCKNMTDDGGGSDLTFSTCFEWDLAPWDLSGSNPRPDLAPDAVNNSWGYAGGSYTEFEDEIDALQAAGIAVDISAGNEGDYGCSTLRSPGDYAQVLTVGSVSYTGGSLPGALSSFSSRGPSRLAPGDYFPDIMAPGDNIRSSVPGSGYAGGWSGTSMAAPHVTGLIGLMWSANPALKGLVAQTYDIIRQTAVPLSGQNGYGCGGNYTTGPNNDWGYGSVDAFAAVDAAIAFGDTGTLTGRVVSSAGQQPLEAVRVAVEGNGWVFTALTDAAGEYTRRVPQGTYTVTVSLYGYLPVSVAGVSIQKNNVTTQNLGMTPAPTHQVRGHVTDSLTGWPLYASLTIDGYPGGPVWTDPVTGAYDVMLVGGTGYTFNVRAWVNGYVATQRVVGPLTGDVVLDVALAADLQLCNAPGYTQSMHEMFSRDFEFQPDGFEVTGAAGWQRGAPTNGPAAAHSGVNVWATNLTGDYGNDADGYLTSPAIDLTAVSGAALQVRWWEWLQTEAWYDVASVEVSANGGATWAAIYNNDGDAALAWTMRTEWLDPQYAAAAFRFRFHFASDYSVVAPGWYVDDVAITSAICNAPAGGGLVVGSVTALDTGLGIADARVENQDGYQVRAAAATDPAGPGFYTIFSPAGSRLFQASAADYVTATATVAVVANGAVRHDFALQSGRPVADPAALDVALVMGERAPLTLTVRNEGSGPLAYTLVEMAAGFDPLQARQVINPVQQRNRVAPTSFVDSGFAAVGDPLFMLDVGATTGYALVLGAEWVNGSWWVTAAGIASPDEPNYLLQLDKDGDILGSWEQGTNSVWGWGDLAFDGRYLYASDGPSVVQIDPATGRTTGAAFPCPLTTCLALAYDPATDHFWSAYFDSGLYEFDRGGTVVNRFDNPLAIFGAAWDFWSPGGPFLWTWSQDGTPRALASQVDPATGGSTGVAFNGVILPGLDNYAGGATIVVDHPDYVGQVILAGVHQAGSDVIVGYDLDAVAGGDVPWLSVQPVSGTIAAHASQRVDVAVDTASIGQPGIYRARLLVDNDSPYGLLSVPVQISVAAPSTWGKVTGTITSLGVCDAAPAPLANASVTLQGNSGITHTVNTDSAGAYSHWVDAVDNPYRVTAVDANHLPGAVAGLPVVAGATVTASMNLRLIASCVTAAPAQVDAAVDFGGATGGALTLTNSGAGAAAFHIGAYSLGRTIAAARVALHENGQAHVVDEGKTVQAPVVNGEATLHGGGPDAFGYTMKDSTAVGGPTYTWVEIAPPAGGSGSALTALDGVDDGYFFPLALPFPFNFYGTDYTRLAVASNGALYFQDAYLGYTNGSIPGNDGGYAVTRLVAPFWDDLTVTPGAIYYEDRGDSFVVEFYAVSACCTSPDAATWEVIFYPNGSVLFQYKDVYFGATNDQGALATVGIQGDTTTGLQYSYNQASLTDSLAICFAYPGAQADCRTGVPWLTATPVSGTIPAGGQLPVTLAFDAGVPEVDQPGSYLARLALRTDGPDQPAPMTATLQVGSPVAWGRIGGTVRSLGNCDASPTPLRNALVTIAGSGGFSQTLPTGEDGTYALWMAADSGPFTVAAAADEHAAQTVPGVVVQAGGRAEIDFDLRWLRSCITVATTAISVTLDAGSISQQTLTLQNTGAVGGQFAVHERAVDATAATTSRPQTGDRHDAPGYAVDPSMRAQRTTQGLNLPPRVVTAQRAAGAVVQKWTPTVNPAPWGIAYTSDGIVWVGEGWGANHMDDYREDGSVIGHTYDYTWNPQFGPADFTYNASTDKIWVMGVSDSSCVYEVDPHTGPTGVSLCPAWGNSQRGLAYDPASGTYFAGNWNDGYIHRFDGSGAILESVFSNIAVAGLAYNPDTGHLFVMENFDPNPVYVLDVNDNYRILGNFAIPNFSAYGGAGMEIGCDGRLWLVDQVTREVYEVESGEATSWCDTDLPWLIPAPVTGSVPAGGSSPVVLTFASGALAPGEYRGTLRVAQDNPGVGMLDVAVTMRVERHGTQSSLFLPIVAR